MKSSSTLLEAADAAGGVQALARRLRVPKKQLASWMEGDADTPPAVFLRAIDFLRRASHGSSNACHEPERLYPCSAAGISIWPRRER